MNHQGRGRSAVVGHTTNAQSITRILREFQEIGREPNPFWCAAPLDQEEPYEWHFTIRGPADSDFAGGLYHGRIVLPQNYPFAPPSVMLLTQNGRFEVGKKVCLSASNYHPELWQPAWGLRTMLDALHAFFPTPGEGALHSLDWPSEVRRKIAKESIDWTCPVCKKSNKTLVATRCSEPTTKRPKLPSDTRNETPTRPEDAKLCSTAITETSPTNIGKGGVQAGTDGSEKPSGEGELTTEAPEYGVKSSESYGSKIPAHRRRPDRGHRSLVGQLVRMPKGRLEAFVCAADVLLLLLVGVILVLLFDLIIDPPALA